MILEKTENAHPILSHLIEVVIERHVINSGGQINLDSESARKNLSEAVATGVLEGMVRMGKAQHLKKKYSKF